MNSAAQTHVLQMSDIVQGLDPTGNCPTFCSLTTLNDQPAWCGKEVDKYQFCYCGVGRLIYFHHWSGIDGDPKYDFIESTGDQDCMSSKFFLESYVQHEPCYYWSGILEGNDYQGTAPTIGDESACGQTPCTNCPNAFQCFCSKTLGELQVSGIPNQHGSTFTIDVAGYMYDSTLNPYPLTRCEEELEFYCYKGTKDIDHQLIYSNKFKIKHQCSPTTPFISESLNTGSDEQIYDNMATCALTLTDSEVFSTLPTDMLSCCPITGLSVFKDISNTSPSPSDLVSPYYGSAPGTGSEDFWTFNDPSIPSNGWKFDGLADQTQSSNRQRIDVSFYVRVTQSGGATYWLGGSGTETQFRLFCDYCSSCSIKIVSGSTNTHYFALNQQNLATANQSVFTNYQLQSDPWFSPGCSQLNSNTLCDAVYLYAFQDAALTIPYSEPSIVLSAADVVQGNPSLSQLTAQTLTIDTSAPFKKQFYLKGMNTGNNFNKDVVNVIVCGNEVVTANSTDLVELALTKHQGFISPGVQSTSSELDYVQSDLETAAWFTDSFDPTTSDQWCLSPSTKSYFLCQTKDSSGKQCQVPWNSPSQLSKISLVHHGGGSTDLRIHLTPFNEVELYLQVQYSLGKVNAFRKLRVAVCGLETINGYQNDTNFERNNGTTEILQKLSYEYEIGSSLDGSSTTFVIDSVGLLKKPQNVSSDLYFVSSNQVNCPVFDCDIVSYVNYDKETGKVLSFSPNNRTSTLQIFSKPVSSGIGFELHIDTQQAFYWETFWIRTFSANNFDTPEANSYVQLDLQIIDCSKETVQVKDPQTIVEINLFVDDKAPVNLTMTGMFQSTNSKFCPITSFKVTKILDKKTNMKKTSSWGKKLFIGQSQDINDVFYKDNFVIQDTSEPLEAKVHIAALTGKSMNDSQDLVVHVKIEMPPNYAPVFFETPDPFILVDLSKVQSELFKQQLPEIYYKNLRDQVDVEFLADEPISELLSYDSEDQSLVINGVQDKHIGIYDIQIVLVNQRNGHTIYEFQLNITNSNLGFEGFKGFEIISDEKIVKQQEYIYSKKPIQARIMKIDQIGQMRVKFSQKMETEILSLNEIQSDLELRLDPFQIPEDFDESLLAFTWNITSFEDDELMIKINFKNPLLISPNLIQDQMLVIFNNMTTFRSTSSNHFENRRTVIMKNIPKQMIDNEQAHSLIQTASLFDMVLNIMFWVLLAFNLVYGGTSSMDHFVLMINSLQIAMHIPLFSIVLPGNVILFLEKVIPIVMFDIIKEEWKVNPINLMQFDEVGYVFTKEEQARMFPGQIQDIGYESHNFIKNVGSMYLFLSIYFFKVFVLGVLKLWQRYSGRKIDVYQKLYNQVVFSDIIILFLEGYMEFCIAGFIRYQCNKSLFSDGSLPAEVYSDIMCCICIFVIIIVIPFILLYTVTRSVNQIKDPSFHDKFWVVTDGLNLERKFAASYYLFFVIRRLNFLAMAFYSFSVPVFQIQLLCLLNFLFSIYQGLQKSKTNRNLNWQETYNEFWTQALTTQLFYFVGDFNTSQEMGYQMGFSIVATLSILIVSNLLVVFWFAARILSLFVFKYYLRFELKCDRVLVTMIQNFRSLFQKDSQNEVIQSNAGNYQAEHQAENLLQLQTKQQAAQNKQNQTIYDNEFSFRECPQYQKFENEIVKNLVNQQVQNPQSFRKEIRNLADIKMLRYENEDQRHRSTELESPKNSLMVEIMNKNLEDWQLYEVVLWLKLEVKLPKYSRDLLMHRFDGSKLCVSSDQDIIDCLGPMPLKDKIILTNALNKLRMHQSQKDSESKMRAKSSLPSNQSKIQALRHSHDKQKNSISKEEVISGQVSIQNQKSKTKVKKPYKDRFLKSNRKYLHQKFSDKQIEKEMKIIEEEFYVKDTEHH